LIGQNNNEVRKSYATGNVSTTYNYSGGLVGYNDAPVKKSYATGTVDGGDGSVGGLVGQSHDTVADSYATGDVTGSSTFGTTGGLVGENRTNEVVTSFSVGAVVDNESSAGGLVGDNDATVTDSYWDTETSGQSTSDGGTGLTTSEMQGSSAQNNMTGFDFNSVWEVV